MQYLKTKAEKLREKEVTSILMAWEDKIVVLHGALWSKKIQCIILRIIWISIVLRRGLGISECNNGRHVDIHVMGHLAPGKKEIQLC